jgi:hypothetical protein
MRTAFAMMVASAAFFACSIASAACEYPEEVTIPEGATADKDDMLEGQKGVKQYMADMQGYIDCLDQESQVNVDDQSEEEKVLHVKRHNAAVEAMETVAARFNEQVRAYKSASN